LTYSNSVDQIVSVLQNAGYKRVSTPFTLAGLQFDVAAVLVGADRSSDLVIVEDTVASTSREIQIRIETIARAMDALDSKRPITAILIGPRPSAVELVAMSRVARILPVGPSSLPDQSDSLRNWLAVLLPLQLPPTGNQLADPLSELSNQLDSDDTVISELLKSAPLGSSAVQRAFHQIIERNLLMPESKGAK
jgi:hypothetical protein